jgi:predicted ATPase/DNA-binding XRE family transcriptional regulator/Tfp pilus assembly protein PilF
MEMRQSSARQFGNLLRHYRMRSGLTQEELADLAHMSVHSISNYERGAPHLPRISTTRLLAGALHLSPDEQTAFIAGVRRQEQRFPADTASSGDALPYAIPLPLTALIGRERELRRAGALLSAGDVRLLTIVGPPGVGKTRVALALALDLARGGAAAGYEETALVSLAPLRDPTHVLGAIASSLRLPEAPTHSVIETIAAFLQDKRTLLLLDNFEHVAASAQQLAELLQQCPDLKALVTSRAPLRLRGERVFDLAPLALPPRTSNAPSSQLTQAPAVALLLERAQARDPAFALTDANAPTLVAICRQLDGLPLAIELAAARFPHLTPEALLARMERRMYTLTTGAPDLPPHQQTLRTTLDWSYTLLTPEAQAAFRWLSVCAGGCAVEVGEALAARAHQWLRSGASASALDLIALLLDHHLLARVLAADDHEVQDLHGDPESSRVGEDARLTILATIQEYASDRLQAHPEEASAAARAHAEVYLDLVETAAPAFRGRQQARWIRRLRQEQDNIRVALRWCVEERAVVPALRFAAALWSYWNTVGMLSEGRDWLEQALALAPPVESLDAAGQRTLAEAYNGAGVLATRQGDFAAAERFHAQALPLRRALGDPLALAFSLNSLGGLLMQQGRLDEAQTAWEESLTYRRQSSDARAIALGLMNLGVLALNRGEARQAVSSVEESVPLFRAAGDASMLSNALINLAMASLLVGELAAAQQQVSEGLQIARERELRRLIGLGLIVQSELAHAKGDLDGAEAVAQEGVAVWREVGDQTNVATTLALLGTLRYERGDLWASEALLQESLALSEQLDDQFNLGDVWTRLAHLARLQGQWDEAAAAYQRSLRIHAQIASTAGAPEALEGLAGVWWDQGEADRALRAYALAQALRVRTGAIRASFNDRWVAAMVGAVHSTSGEPSWQARIVSMAALTMADLEATLADFIGT